MKRTLGAALVAVASVVAVGLSTSCGTKGASAGETCSTYATGKVCADNLSCQCADPGCFCVATCTPGGDGGCSAGLECMAGFLAGQGQTGYFCFPPDGGS